MTIFTTPGQLALKHKPTIFNSLSRYFNMQNLSSKCGDTAVLQLPYRYCTTDLLQPPSSLNICICIYHTHHITLLKYSAHPCLTHDLLHTYTYTHALCCTQFIPTKKVWAQLNRVICLYGYNATIFA